VAAAAAVQLLRPAILDVVQLLIGDLLDVVQLLRPAIISSSTSFSYSGQPSLLPIEAGSFCSFYPTVTKAGISSSL